MYKKRQRDIEAKSKIIANVCRHFKVKAYDLLKPGKGVAALNIPRYLCLYLLHTKANYTYAEAAKVLNRKSCVSAFTACLKIEKKIREGDKTVLGFLYKFGWKQGAVSGVRKNNNVKR